VTYSKRDLFALAFGVSIWKASKASGSTGSPVSPLSSLGWARASLASGQDAAGLMVQCEWTPSFETQAQETLHGMAWHGKLVIMMEWKVAVLWCFGVLVFRCCTCT
jgi:hypothetical protein